MSSGFVSEAEIAEQRRTRQEEWERVRTADQPLERPEEPFDSRSLYERLQEQKNKRDAEYEEAHKLKNMIRGLDDDEVEFLDLVDRTKMEEERKKNLEEEKEIRDFKAAVASLQEKSLDERLKQELKRPRNPNSSSGSCKNAQLKLLAGVVTRKPTRQNHQGNGTRGVERKSPADESGAEGSPPTTATTATNSEGSALRREADGGYLAKEARVVDGGEKSARCDAGALRRVGILPGLGSYDRSSDSDCSSDTDQDPEQTQTRYDLLGRKIGRETKQSKDKEKR